MSTQSALTSAARIDVNRFEETVENFLHDRGKPVTIATHSHMSQRRTSPIAIRIPDNDTVIDVSCKRQFSQFGVRVEFGNFVSSSTRHTAKLVNDIVGALVDFL